MRAQAEIEEALAELTESIIDCEDEDFWFDDDCTLHADERRAALRVLRWVLWVLESKQEGTPDNG